MAKTKPRTPEVGNPLLLDGFLYRLGPTKKEFDEHEQVVLIRFFERPPPASPAEAAAHQGNYNYKLGGKCADAELVWYEPHDLLAELRTQAAQLARGNAGLRAWADAAATVQAEVIEAMGSGAWTLPGRHLLKPTVQLRVLPDGSKAEMAIVPSSPETAEQLARAVLAHQVIYDQTKEG